MASTNENKTPAKWPPLKPVTDLSELPDTEREHVAGIVSDLNTVVMIMYSDMLFSGVFGMARLILTNDEIIVSEENEVDSTVRVPLEEIVSATCRDYVGNGLLEIRTKNEQRRELIRYSRTLGDAFQEASQFINAELVQAAEEEVEAHQAQAEKISGVKEDTEAHRCPECGYPLSHANDSCPRCTHKRQTLRRLLKMVLEHRRVLIPGTILGILVVGINLVPPYLVRLLIDEVMRKGDLADAERFRRLYMLVGCFFSIMVIRSVALHYRIHCLGKLGARVVRDLRQSIFRALQRLSLSYYDREHTGRIMARVLGDAERVNQFVVGGLQRMLMHGIMVLAIPVIMLVTNPDLALIALAPVPVVIVLGRVFSKKFKSIYRVVRRRYANMSQTLSDSVAGMRVVKSFAQEDREVGTFDDKSMNHYNAQVDAVHTRALFNPSVVLMMAVGTLVVWLVGGRSVITGAVELGVLVQFLSYMNQLYNPVQQLLQLTEQYQQSTTAAERVFSVMDTPPDVKDSDKAIEPSHVQGHLNIENVSFHYDNSERVLKDINLEIKPGEMVGLVGETGSGKSTLASLVCRFYDPTRGHITLDGEDLRNIKSRWLRQNIGMVLQDTFLFAGSIRDNITYGKPEATEKEIIHSAKAANAHDFIMNLPDAYDTEVGERGVGLSGGEKQRIAIARAILKDPAILILDEATSAVDTATELVIQEAMQRLVQGRTTIAIAHRLSTLRNADKLLVLENGEIIEQGTHEELMRNDGRYAKLCRIQADFARHLTTGDKTDNETERSEEPEMRIGA